MNSSNMADNQGVINNSTSVEGKYNQTGGINVSQSALPSVPTTEYEYNAGNPAQAGLGYDVPLVKESIVGIRDSGPTLQLTDLPLLLTEDRNQTGSQRNVLVNDSHDLASVRVQKDPIPFCCMKGTNALIAFGASYTLYSRATNSVTSLGASTSLRQLGTFSGRFRSPASVREIYAYKSFGEMKDAIISYRSRSIAFTNLAQEDMFQLEIAREQILANAALIFFASKAARDYCAMLTRRGLKYNPALISNILDPEVNKMELVLFSDLAGQKTFDPTLYHRMGMFSRIHESSAKVGPIPQLILQDVIVPPLRGYNIQNVASSGYTINVPQLDGAMQAVAANHGISFLNVLSLYLGGLNTRQELLALLNNMAAFINNTINGLKIITGAIDTIEANRGAQFSYVGEYLPIQGKHHEQGNCFLDYIEEDPQFSYFFKERFEHAPQQAPGESTTGVNNWAWSTNLASGLADAFVAGDFNTQELFSRPAGLYKGDNAWQTDEIAYIGVFRPLTVSSNAADIAMVALSAGVVGSASTIASSVGVRGADMNGAGTTFTTTSAGVIEFSGNGQNISYTTYMDAIYGDMYSTFLGMRVAGTLGLVINNGPIVAVCGSNLLSSNTGSVTTASPVGTVSWVPPIGTYVLGGAFKDFFSGLGFSATAADTVAIYYSFGTLNLPNVENTYTYTVALLRLTRLFSNLDLTEPPLIRVDLTTGQVDPPAFVEQGYRGAYWYYITLSTVENTIIDAANAFTLTYKNNAQVRADRNPTNIK